MTDETPMDTYRNRAPGWLLREIRDEWRCLIRSLAGSLEIDACNKSEANYIGRVIRFAFEMLECTSGEPFDRERARAEIAATWERIEREWSQFPEVKR